VLVSGCEADQCHDSAHRGFEEAQGLGVREHVGVRGAGEALVDLVDLGLSIALENDLLEGVPVVDLCELAGEDRFTEVNGEEVGPVVASLALGVACDGFVEDGLNGRRRPCAGAFLVECAVGCLHQPVEEQDAPGPISAHGGRADADVVVRAVLLDRRFKGLIWLVGLQHCLVVRGVLLVVGFACLCAWMICAVRSSLVSSACSPPRQRQSSASAPS
jgi:hypothetical protein